MDSHVPPSLRHTSSIFHQSQGVIMLPDCLALVSLPNLVLHRVIHIFYAFHILASKFCKDNCINAVVEINFLRERVPSSSVIQSKSLPIPSILTNFLSQLQQRPPNVLVNLIAVGICAGTHYASFSTTH